MAGHIKKVRKEYYGGGGNNLANQDKSSMRESRSRFAMAEGYDDRDGAYSSSSNSNDVGMAPDI